jgi:hypothetical protein
MTGGAHDNYMSDIDGNYQFDIAKWRARMDEFDVPEIQAAVAQAVADGVILGNSVMDEPHNEGLPDDGGNTWGSPNLLTKAIVDSLCAYVKDIFPTLPVGVAHRHGVFFPEVHYGVCEFIMDQYSERLGDVDDYITDTLAWAEEGDGVGLVFSINILNGGTQDRDGDWDCPQSGPGTRSPNCWMTAEQVREYATKLGVHGCAMTMWRYDAEFSAVADNQQAFTEVAALLATRPRVPCTRP